MTTVFRSLPRVPARAIERAMAQAGRAPAHEKAVPLALVSDYERTRMYAEAQRARRWPSGPAGKPVERTNATGARPILRSSRRSAGDTEFTRAIFSPGAPVPSAVTETTPTACGSLYPSAARRAGRSRDDHRARATRGPDLLSSLGRCWRSPAV